MFLFLKSRRNIFSVFMWSVEFLGSADKDLEKLSYPVRRRIIEKIEWLRENFDLVPPISLRGEFSDFFKFRIGDWRVFYRVNWTKKIIAICYVEHRSRTYKKPKS